MSRLAWAMCLLAVAPWTVLAESEDLKDIDPVMGNWEGDWSDEYSGAQGICSAKIVARGSGHYACHFQAEVDGNLVPFEFPLKEKTKGVPDFTGKINLGEERGGEATFNYSFKDGVMNGSVENDAVKVSIEMERVYLKPANLGAEAPEGAIILFDGTNLDQFSTSNGKPAKWNLSNGAMQVKPGSGSIVSKEKFKDQQLHIEFRTPFMPLMRGQGRGNSGVYVGGNFEVQVLDSFGEPARDNEAGGIYQIAVPRENAALPPGEWQVYDITYYAPETNEKGEITEPGEITVVYNDKTIHERVPVKEITKGGVGGDMGKPGALLLQDHGNLVEFRNIWVKPLPPRSDAEKK